MKRHIRAVRLPAGGRENLFPHDDCTLAVIEHASPLDAPKPDVRHDAPIHTVLLVAGTLLQ